MAIGSCDLANILDKIVLSEHWKWLFSWSIKISKFSRRKTPDPQAAHPIGAHVIRRWSKISRFYILKRYLWRIERYIWGKLTSRVLTVKAVLKLKKLISSHLKNIWPTSVSQKRPEVSCWRRCTAWSSRRSHEENQLWFSWFRGTQRGYSSKPLNIALLNVF